MKVPSTCAALATLLSSNYNTTERYIPTGNRSDLTAYLSNNGILLSMCMFDFCAVDPQDDRISASWVQNTRTGFRYIPTSLIGYILDPSAVFVKCIYPTDAYTAQRSGAGCGPSLADPIYGDLGYNHMNNLSRYNYMKSLERFEQFNFGSWNASEIPCNKRYSLRSGNGGKKVRRTYLKPITWSSNYALNETTYSTVLATYASWDEPFVGRPTCNINDEIPTFDNPDSMFVYMDATSWDPVSQWQNVMDSMSTTFGQYRTPFWNEIVLDLPMTTMNDVLLAIFIIVDSTMDDGTIKAAYERAVLESNLLDNDHTKRKPILVINTTALEHNEPLFKCADDNWYIDLWNTKPEHTKIT